MTESNDESLPAVEQAALLLAQAQKEARESGATLTAQDIDRLCKKHGVVLIPAEQSNSLRLRIAQKGD